MQVSQRTVRGGVILLGVLAGILSGGIGHASPSPAEPLHWSGDQTSWDRKSNRVELTGNATIHRRQETLVSDHAILDLKAREVHARGHVYYATPHTIIQAEEIHFHLDSLVGTIIGARVTDGRFLLLGDRINRLSEDRYQTHNAEYTACRDCPASWSLVGGDVDMEFGGYALMSDVVAKVRDTPVLWAPYLILPLKTERQTGLLFPTMGVSGAHGFTLVQQLFVAFSRSADATVGLGTYSANGVRAQVEARYASRGGAGIASFFHTMDVASPVPSQSRWGFKLEQSQDLGAGLLQRLRINDISDNRYPLQFGEDVSSGDNPALTSDISLSQSGTLGSAYVESRIFRNLLNTESASAFDLKTVQLLPRVEIASRAYTLGDGPVAFQFRTGMSHFTRWESSADADTVGTPAYGGSIVRKALRFHLNPKLFATLRPWDAFSLIPSVQYRGFVYSFFNDWPSLIRGYLLAQLDASVQFYKIYPTEDPSIPQIKHTISPFVTYSVIPHRYEPSHLFLDQVTANKAAFVFDTQDIVPIGTDTPTPTNYFLPLGHSISYGFNTQLIRKRAADGAFSYQRAFDLSAGQTLNFLEFNKAPSLQVPFSRLFATTDVALDRFGWATQYYFYPQVNQTVAAQTWELSPHEVSTSLTYYLEKTVKQQVLEYERSISLGYSFRQLDARANNLQATLKYSVSDYFMPSVGLSYDFVSAQYLTVSGSLMFQSPSRCWRLVISVYRNYGQAGFHFRPDFTINLTGASWGGVGEFVDNVYSGSK